MAGWRCGAIVKKLIMYVCKQIFVSGHVQGVFFRDSTRQIARQLKLTGGVRNLRDGRVEVLVAGDETSLQSLIKWLKIGPKLAKVSTIEVLDYPVSFLQEHRNSQFEIWATK
jgi:acylphosphatase